MRKSKLKIESISGKSVTEKSAAKLPVRILAPAGNFESLAAAINAGADAIYFGCGALNMRARAGSFVLSDLPEIVKRCHNAKIAAYLALNTVMYDNDLEQIHIFCKAAVKAKVDALICTDIAAIQIARSYNLRVHISTQQSVSNIEAVRFFSTFADTIVLARELTLAQIKVISKQIVDQKIRGPSGQLVELEAFVHGALCVAVAGKCGMSLATYNASANRGACFQVCRREYRVTDVETDNELVIDGKYVMSPKDLCTLGMLAKLVDAGVHLLKIEGRARGPEYVTTVVSVYKEAISLISKGKYNSAAKQKLIDEVSKVYNRGFWQNGYYMGVQAGEWCSAAGSVSTLVKTCVGFVENYYPKAGVALVKVESGEVAQGCNLAFTGPTTGYLECDSAAIRVDDKIPTKVLAGGIFTVRVPSIVRKNDKVFVITTRSVN